MVMESPQPPSDSLYGRTKEWVQLMDAYERIKEEPFESKKQTDGSSKKNLSHLVVISGPRGCGKTFFAVQGLKERLIQQDNGLLLQWKFDQSNHLRVGGGMLGCFSGLSRELLERRKRDPVAYQAIQRRLDQALSFTERRLLVAVIPSLREVLFSRDYSDVGDKDSSAQKEVSPLQDNENDISVSEDDFNSFNTSGLTFKAFGNLYKALGNPQHHPLVTLLDDYHWTDPSALHWSSSLMKNRFARGTLYVITCDAFDPSNESDWVKRVQQMLHSEEMDVTHIQLDNLKRDSVQRIVEDILSTQFPSKSGGALQQEDIICSQIVDAVYERTQGSPRHVHEMMQQMFQEGIIRKGSSSIMTFQQEILNDWHFESTAELLRHRVLLLPAQLQQVLKVAACFGRSCNSENVSIGASSSEMGMLAVKEALVRLVDLKMLVENNVMTTKRVNDTKLSIAEYSFVHNSMQEAAYFLLGGDNAENEEQHTNHRRSLFHLVVGRKLLKQHVTRDTLSGNLLATVGQLMLGADAIQDREEKYSVARWCLQAGVLCVHLTSFLLASRCMEKGIYLLEKAHATRPRHWHDEYDLSLTIHNAAAEIAWTTGNFQMVQELVTTVQQHARSFDDKLRVFIINISTLWAKRESARAIHAGLKVLAQLGERFPRRATKRHVMMELMRTRLLLRGKSDESILRLPNMTDQQVLAIMQVLNIVFSAVFLTSPMLAPLLTLRMVRLSIEHGVCAISSFGFGMFGVLVFSFLGKVEESDRYGQVALKLLNRFNTKEFIPRVYLAVYGNIHGRNTPLQKALRPLKRAYRVGVECGDIEIALFNITTFQSIRFEIGVPLSELRQGMGHVFEELACIRRTSSKHDVRFQTFLLHAYQTLSQIIGSLSGVNNTPPNDEDSSKHTLFEQLWLDHHKMVLAYILGDYEKAVAHGSACRALPYLPFQRTVLASFLLVDGLSCVALYKQQKRKRSHLIVARRHCRTLHKLVGKGAREYFFLSKKCLLQAELFSVRRFDAAMEHYNYAISLAAKANLLMGEAIACENKGRLLRAHNEEGYISCFEDALSLYTKWEAWAKVEKLRTDMEQMMHNNDRVS